MKITCQLRPSPQPEKKKSAPMSDDMKALVDKFFSELDENKDGYVTKKEALNFWKSKQTKFPMVSAQGMFNETDTDANLELSRDEWQNFWQQVLDHGYSEDEVMEELNNMINGEVWRDWMDGRAPGSKP